MRIIIQDFDKSWVGQFQHHKSIIQNILASFNPSIEHIGSTSVDGLGAKPIIDILVGLPNEADLDRIIPLMINTNYCYIKKYEPYMPYRRFFQKLSSNDNKQIPKLIDLADKVNHEQEFEIKANIHIVVKGTEFWIRLIAFRNYLAQHPDIRLKYDQLKKELSKKDWKDVIEYNNAKNDFIKNVEKIAVQSYNDGLTESSYSQQ